MMKFNNNKNKGEKKGTLNISPVYCDIYDIY